MAWYRYYIYSVGGGVDCEGPLEFKNKSDAEGYAYDMAINDYESFEGYHGIPVIGDIFDNWEDYGFEEYPLKTQLGIVIKRNEKVGLITGWKKQKMKAI